MSHRENLRAVDEKCGEITELLDNLTSELVTKDDFDGLYQDLVMNARSAVRALNAAQEKIEQEDDPDLTNEIEQAKRMLPDSGAFPLHTPDEISDEMETFRTRVSDARDILDSL